MVNVLGNEYYLVFTDSNSSFLNFFLKKQFSHVFFIAKYHNGWYILDARYSALYSQVVKLDFDLIKFYSERQHKIIKVNLNNAHKRFIPKLIPFLTCVTLSQYALGINFLCVTPYQLYKKLIKLFNAKEVIYER